MHQQRRPKRDAVRAPQHAHIALLVLRERRLRPRRLDRALAEVREQRGPSGRELPERDDALVRVRVGVGEEEEDGRERVAEDGGGEDGEGGGERDGAVYGAQGGGEEGGEEEVEGCDDADALELVGDAEEERAVRRQLFFFWRGIGEGGLTERGC